MIWLAAPALAAAAYYLLAIVAAVKWLAAQSRAAAQPASALPPISILKPVHGRDAAFYEAIRSHALQDYPEFEILFGTDSECDPALEDIARLQREFPKLRIEARVIPNQAPNSKAGVLAGLAQLARHPVLLVNDSDIVVEPAYLKQVAAALGRPGAGLVTCIYRARAGSPAARFEALGIATEFAPSVMVARLLGQAEFALGSTMAFPAKHLRAVGGFEAIQDFLADDYQLGRRICELGYRIEFAPAAVETNLGDESWAEAWRHQLRWSRTIRVSRPGGYYGYIVTHATFWALVAFAAGQWTAGLAAIVARMVAAALAGIALRDRYASRLLWLVPLRDLFGFAVWVGGAFGNSIHWRDRKLTLRRDGRIQR